MIILPDVTQYAIEIAAIYTAITIVATALAFLGYKTGRSKAIEQILKPYRDSLEGYETQTRQQTAAIESLEKQKKELHGELHKVMQEKDDIVVEKEELEKHLMQSAKLIFRMSGELDQIKVRMTMLESLVGINNRLPPLSDKS